MEDTIHPSCLHLTSASEVSTQPEIIRGLNKVRVATACIDILNLVGNPFYDCTNANQT